MLFGNAMSLMYSISGTVISFLVMLLLKHLNILSVVGVSVAGGITHNLGQILMAILLLDTIELGYYMVVLTVTGVVAGVLVGLCGAVLVKKIPENVLFL